VGSGGTFIFTFEAAAPGEAALRLIYRRPFEKKAAPAEIFEVTVVVK
jgi:predicted secreted protein